MTLFRRHLHAWFFVLGLATQLVAQDQASGHYQELSETQLLSELKQVVEKDLVAARPIILELMKRTEDKTRLETYTFLVALSYQDEYAASKEESALSSAVEYYRKYVNEFPGGVRIDFVRFNLAGALADLDQWREAIEVYKYLYERSENSTFRLESRNLLCNLYIKNNAAGDGIPIFLEVFNGALLNPELRAQAASWLLQGYLAQGEPSKILPYMRYLTGDFEATFDPKFNITLLKAGDSLFDKGDYDQAILLYSLVKPRDDILEFFEELVRTFELKLSYLGEDSEAYTVTEGRLNTARASLKAVREVRAYDVDMRWRVARVFLRTDRTWEALWAFYHLYQDFPEHEQVENFLFLAFSQAKSVNEESLIESLALEYLARKEWVQYRDQVIVDLADFYRAKMRGEDLIELADGYHANPTNMEVAAQLINYEGLYMVEAGQYNRLIAYMGDLVKKFQGKDPAYEAARYWQGLGYVLKGEYQLGGDAYGSFLADYTDSSVFYEDVFYRHAICLYGQQLHTEAEDRFTRFVAKYADSELRGEAELYLGDLKRDRRAFDEALVHYDSVPNFTNNVAFITKAAFAASEVLDKGGRPDEAFARLQSYYDTYGEKGEAAEAFWRMGMIRDRQARPAERFEIHGRAIRLFGNDPMRYAVDSIIEKYVGDFLKYEQRFKETIALLDRLQGDAEFADQFLLDRTFQYGFIQSDKGRLVDPDIAILLIRDRDFRSRIVKMEMIEDESGKLTTQSRQVVVHDVLNKELDKLKERFKALLDSISAHRPEPFFRAMRQEATADGRLVEEMRASMALELASGKPGPAVFTVEQLAEAPPAVIYWQARKREKIDRAEAEALFSSIVDKHPFSDTVYDALIALGEMAVAAAEGSGERDDWEKALGYFTLINERYAMRADTAMPYLRMGYILSNLGRGDDAIDVLAAILRNPTWKGKDHAKAHLEIGLAYMRDGRLAEAHGFFERLIVAYGGYGEILSWAYYYDLQVLEDMGEAESVKMLLQEYKDRSSVLKETEAYKLINERYSI